MVAEGVSPGNGGPPADRMRVLLVEDDDGDALLVDELLLDAGAPFALMRARTLAEAGPLLAGTVAGVAGGLVDGMVLSRPYLDSIRGSLLPLAALIGASRVVLGLHYPSDVLAGGALGALLAVLGLACG